MIGRCKHAQLTAAVRVTQACKPGAGGSGSLLHRLRPAANCRCRLLLLLLLLLLLVRLLRLLLLLHVHCIWLLLLLRLLLRLLHLLHLLRLLRQLLVPQHLGAARAAVLAALAASEVLEGACGAVGRPVGELADVVGRRAGHGSIDAAGPAPLHSTAQRGQPTCSRRRHATAPPPPRGHARTAGAGSEAHAVQGAGT